MDAATPMKVRVAKCNEPRRCFGGRVYGFLEQYAREGRSNDGDSAELQRRQEFDAIKRADGNFTGYKKPVRKYCVPSGG